MPQATNPAEYEKTVQHLLSKNDGTNLSGAAGANINKLA